MGAANQPGYSRSVWNHRAKGPCKNKSRLSKRKGDILHEGVIGVVKVEDYREANVYSP